MGALVSSYSLCCAVPWLLRLLENGGFLRQDAVDPAEFAAAVGIED